MCEGCLLFGSFFQSCCLCVFCLSGETNLSWSFMEETEDRVPQEKLQNLCNLKTLLHSFKWVYISDWPFETVILSCNFFQWKCILRLMARPTWCYAVSHNQSFNMGVWHNWAIELWKRSHYWVQTVREELMTIMVIENIRELLMYSSEILLQILETVWLKLLDLQNEVQTGFRCALFWFCVSIMWLK